jgi:DNA invertase Pin-like site-specific DNA recombinase
MNTFGYIRVSTVAQNTDRQLIAMVAAARARGVRFGRPAIPLPANFAQVIQDWESKTLRLADVVAQTGLSPSTFYRRLREFRNRDRTDGVGE